MNYAIVIPAWNEADFLGDTLRSIQQAMQAVVGHHGDLIVVDNHSTDDTAAIAERAGVRVVFEPINQIARARNAGARAAGGDALVFIDADSAPPAALLQRALDRLDTGRVVGGGAMLAPDKPIDDLARSGLEFWNRIGRRLNVAAGCFLFVRRDAFDAIGGFDERVYAGEEIFLSRRLKRHGRRRGMRFEIIPEPPVITSVRKLEWYTPMQLARQAALVLIPGAVFSRFLCGTWYDRDLPRAKAPDNPQPAVERAPPVDR